MAQRSRVARGRGGARGWRAPRATRDRGHYLPDLRSNGAGPCGGSGIACLRDQPEKATPAPIAALSAPANRYTSPAAVLVITALPLGLDIASTKDASNHPIAGASAPPALRIPLPHSTQVKPIARAKPTAATGTGPNAPAVLEGTGHPLQQAEQEQQAVGARRRGCLTADRRPLALR